MNFISSSFTAFWVALSILIGSPSSPVTSVMRGSTACAMRKSIWLKMSYSPLSISTMGFDRMRLMCESPSSRTSAASFLFCIDFPPLLPTAFWFPSGAPMVFIMKNYAHAPSRLGGEWYGIAKSVRSIIRVHRNRCVNSIRPRKPYSPALSSCDATTQTSCPSTSCSKPFFPSSVVQGSPAFGCCSVLGAHTLLPSTSCTWNRRPSAIW